MKNSGEKRSYFKGIMIVSFLFFAVTASILIMNESQERAEIQEQAAIDKLNMEQEQMELFNQIEKNLAEITAHEDIVRLNLSDSETEGPLSPEERINNEIAIISDLIEQNNTLIADLQSQLASNNEDLLAYSERNKRLERKLSKFSKRVDELEKMNANLAQEKTALENENLQLSSDLDFANTQMDSQFVYLTASQTEIAELNHELNETYYLVGDYKELKALDIIEKEGGIIGIGATKELKDDFNKTPFIQIDKTVYTTIPVFSDKAELATNHPTNSYRWVQEGDEVKWLEIVKPEEFWESSKYLVILTGKDFSLIKSA